MWGPLLPQPHLLWPDTAQCSFCSLLGERSAVSQGEPAGSSSMLPAPRLQKRGLRRQEHRITRGEEPAARREHSRWDAVLAANGFSAFKCFVGKQAVTQYCPIFVAAEELLWGSFICFKPCTCFKETHCAFSTGGKPASPWPGPRPSAYVHSAQDPQYLALVVGQIRLQNAG